MPKFDELPEKDLASGDYLLTSSEGATSRSEVNVSSLGNLGLVTKTDYASENDFGIVKVDNTTITSKAGVISG